MLEEMEFFKNINQDKISGKMGEHSNMSDTVVE
jgi:hypothetical protein